MPEQNPNFNTSNSRTVLQRLPLILAVLILLAVVAGSIYYIKHNISNNNEPAKLQGSSYSKEAIDAAFKDLFTQLHVNFSPSIVNMKDIAQLDLPEEIAVFGNSNGTILFVKQGETLDGKNAYYFKYKIHESQALADSQRYYKKINSYGWTNTIGGFSQLVGLVLKDNSKYKALVKQSLLSDQDMNVEVIVVAK